MEILEDKFFIKNIQIWFFGVLPTPILASWDYLFRSNEILSIGDFIGNIFFGAILTFSFTTPLWFLFFFINRFLCLKIKSERLLNLLINLLAIIIGMIILASIHSLKDNEIFLKLFLFIFLHVVLCTFFTWIIKVDRGYVKVIKEEEKKKSGLSRPDILDDDLD